ncbi:unnamed protein product [Sphenostylis stenocarpa]|uniref:Uncharacterized protein n=1 Tax=Sphenostylis stenocarpa TaxID=92480 RepID=A0AA86SMT2_9FABA|nr:unnamed protein product [Sphenostylis stenocarpa]
MHEKHVASKEEYDMGLVDRKLLDFGILMKEAKRITRCIGCEREIKIGVKSDKGKVCALEIIYEEFNSE